MNLGKVRGTYGLLDVIFFIGKTVAVMFMKMSVKEL